MARDGLIFSFLGISIALVDAVGGAADPGAVAIIMVSSSGLRYADHLLVVVEWAALIFAVAAVFVLRRKMADAPRPFRTPAYPWVPISSCSHYRRFVGHRLGTNQS